MIQDLKVDGQQLKGLLSYEASNEPMWADDAGRNNMDGTFTGTFCGYSPSLTLEFGDLSTEDMEYNCSLLEMPIVTITYEDRKSGQLLTMEFCGSAISTKVSRYDGRYEGFSINLAGVSNL